MWLRIETIGAVFREGVSELSGPYNRGISLSSRYSGSLRAVLSGDRIPVGTRCSTPVQTGPGALPASYTMGTGSFPRINWPGRGVDHPPPFSSEVKERVKLYLYSTSGPLVACYRVNFTSRQRWNESNSILHF